LNFGTTVVNYFLIRPEFIQCGFKQNVDDVHMKADLAHSLGSTAMTTTRFSVPLPYMRRCTEFGIDNLRSPSYPDGSVLEPSFSVMMSTFLPTFFLLIRNLQHSTLKYFTLQHRRHGSTWCNAVHNKNWCNLDSFEICERTDMQTDIHTARNTSQSHPYWGEGLKVTFKRFYLPYLENIATNTIYLHIN